MTHMRFGSADGCEEVYGDHRADTAMASPKCPGVECGLQNISYARILGVKLFVNLTSWIARKSILLQEWR